MDNLLSDIWYTVKSAIDPGTAAKGAIPLLSRLAGWGSTALAPVRATGSLAKNLITSKPVMGGAGGLMLGESIHSRYLREASKKVPFLGPALSLGHEFAHNILPSTEVLGAIGAGGGLASSIGKSNWATRGAGQGPYSKLPSHLASAAGDMARADAAAVEAARSAMSGYRLRAPIRGLGHLGEGAYKSVTNVPTLLGSGAATAYGLGLPKGQSRIHTALVRGERPTVAGPEQEVYDEINARANDLAGIGLWRRPSANASEAERAVYSNRLDAFTNKMEKAHGPQTLASWLRENEFKPEDSPTVSRLLTAHPKPTTSMIGLGGRGKPSNLLPSSLVGTKPEPTDMVTSAKSKPTDSVSASKSETGIHPTPLPPEPPSSFKFPNWLKGVNVGVGSLAAGYLANRLAGDEEDEEGNKRSRMPWLGPLVGLGGLAAGARHITGGDWSKLKEPSFWKSSAARTPMVMIPYRMKLADDPVLPIDPLFPQPSYSPPIISGANVSRPQVEPEVPAVKKPARIRWSIDKPEPTIKLPTLGKPQAETAPVLGKPQPSEPALTDVSKPVMPYADREQTPTVPPINKNEYEQKLPPTTPQSKVEQPWPSHFDPLYQTQAPHSPATHYQAATELSNQLKQYLPQQQAKQDWSKANPYAPAGGAEQEIKPWLQPGQEDASSTFTNMGGKEKEYASNLLAQYKPEMAPAFAKMLEDPSVKSAPTVVQGIAQKAIAKDPNVIGKAQANYFKQEKDKVDPRTAQDPSFLENLYAKFMDMPPLHKILLGAGLGFGAISLLMSMTGGGGEYGSGSNFLGPLLGLGALGGAGYLAYHHGLFDNTPQTPDVIGNPPAGQPPSVQTGGGMFKSLADLAKDPNYRQIATVGGFMGALANPAQHATLQQAWSNFDPKLKQQLTAGLQSAAKGDYDSFDPKYRDVGRRGLQLLAQWNTQPVQPTTGGVGPPTGPNQAAVEPPKPDAQTQGKQIADTVVNLPDQHFNNAQHTFANEPTDVQLHTLNHLDQSAWKPSDPNDPNYQFALAAKDKAYTRSNSLRDIMIDHKMSQFFSPNGQAVQQEMLTSADPSSLATMTSRMRQVAKDPKLAASYGMSMSSDPTQLQAQQAQLTKFVQASDQKIQQSIASAPLTGANLKLLMDWYQDKNLPQETKDGFISTLHPQRQVELYSEIKKHNQMKANDSTYLATNGLNDFAKGSIKPKNVAVRLLTDRFGGAPGDLPNPVWNQFQIGVKQIAGADPANPNLPKALVEFKTQLADAGLIPKDQQIDDNYALNLAKSLDRNHVLPTTNRKLRALYLTDADRNLIVEQAERTGIPPDLPTLSPFADDNYSLPPAKILTGENDLRSRALKLTGYYPARNELEMGLYDPGDNATTKQLPGYKTFAQAMNENRPVKTLPPGMKELPKFDPNMAKFMAPYLALPPQTAIPQLQAALSNLTTNQLQKLLNWSKTDAYNAPNPYQTNRFVGPTDRGNIAKVISDAYHSRFANLPVEQSKPVPNSQSPVTY